MSRSLKTFWYKLTVSFHVILQNKSYFIFLTFYSACVNEAILQQPLLFIERMWLQNLNKFSQNMNIKKLKIFAIKWRHLKMNLQYIKVYQKIWEEYFLVNCNKCNQLYITFILNRKILKNITKFVCGIIWKTAQLAIQNFFRFV